MKKIILIVFIALLVIGCNKLSEKQIKELESKLMEQAEEIFITDLWTNGGIKTGTYTLTLRDLKEKMKLDISEFKNPNTKEYCDIDKSKIEFVVSEQKEPDKTNYQLKVAVICEEK